MKKKIRIIALAMAFCIVFAISASAYQIDAVHTYDYFQPLTDISCHGYIGVSQSNGNVGIWASTEISHPVDMIFEMTVTCTFNGVNGAQYAEISNTKQMTSTDTVVLAENTNVTAESVYGYLNGYHLVEFEDPGTGDGDKWEDVTNGIYPG